MPLSKFVKDDPALYCLSDPVEINHEDLIAFFLIWSQWVSIRGGGGDNDRLDFVLLSLELNVVTSLIAVYSLWLTDGPRFAHAVIDPQERPLIIGDF